MSDASSSSLVESDGYRSQTHFGRGVGRITWQAGGHMKGRAEGCCEVSGWLTCLLLKFLERTLTQRALGEQTQVTRDDALLPSFEPLSEGDTHRQASLTQSNSETVTAVFDSIHPETPWFSITFWNPQETWKLTLFLL